MNRRIKVLHFIWSANFGGIEKMVIDLVRAQGINGLVDAEILIGSRKGSFIEKLAELDLKHSFIGLRSGLDFRPSAFRNILKKMQECDIIHLHTFNLLVAVAAAASGKKIIYTIHGNFNFGRKVRLSDRVSQFLKKVFLKKYPDFISYNSEFTKKTAISRFGTGKVYGKVIHNGIFQDHPSPISNPDHLEKIKNKFIVGTSSRFAGFKRIDRLIDGFAQFASDKENVLLLLVGDGILRDKLEKQVELKNISSKTLFAGYQGNVVNYQAVMDVCVFPSENEPFGLVAVETLRLGKPTIVFNDGGGMCEIMRVEFPEEVVTDVQDLSQRLNFHYTNNEINNENIIQRRKQFAESFDALKMEKTFYQEYLHVLGN